MENGRLVQHLTTDMPIFAYSCGSCGHAFDALQKLNAEPLTDCPECGDAALRKLVSAPNVHARRPQQPTAPKPPPRFAHTFDSPTPHAEHHHHGHDHGHGHKHDHKK